MATLHDEYIGLLNKGYEEREAWLYLLKVTKNRLTISYESKNKNNIEYYYNNLIIIKNKLKK